MAGFTNSFDTLTAYVNQHAISEFMTPAIIPATLDSTLGSGIDVLDNVKYKTAIPKLTISAKVQAQSCNPTASGTTTITQVVGEVCPLMIVDKFCFIGTTNQYFFNEFMKAGSDYQNNEWFNNTFIPEAIS